MSAARRRRPDDPARRGWCPSLARPMPTGDGLLARVHPPLGVLSAVQLRAVAEAARRYGNSHFDVTARGNLQIRGTSETTAPALAAFLADAGLADVRADGGPQRLTLTSALAGIDADECIDVPALARAIEAVGLTVPGLPAKTLVAIDSGGRWGLGAAEADVFVGATRLGHVAVGLASELATLWSADIAVGDVPPALGRALNAFAGMGRRRMRDLDETERVQVMIALAEPLRASPSPLCGRGWPLRQQGSGEGNAVFGDITPLSRPAPRATLPHPKSGLPDLGTVRTDFGQARDRLGGRDSAVAPEPGLIPLPSGLAAAVAEAPFGRCTADSLDAVAALAGQEGIRLTTARGLVLFVPQAHAAATLAAVATAGFITDPADPRRAVAACPGAPACASGTTPVPDHAAELAKAFAPFAARGLAAHVSGCAKGCAHPREADLTLVAEEGRYRVVVDGAPGDAAQGECLSFEAALDRVRRTDPAESLARTFRP